MEPLEVPSHAIWRDDFEGLPPDQWAEGEFVWACHGAIAHANAKPHGRWRRRRHNLPNSTLAMDAASCWTRPIPSLRRSGLPSGRIEEVADRSSRNPACFSKRKAGGSGNPCPEATLFGHICGKAFDFSRKILTERGGSGHSTPDGPFPAPTSPRPPSDLGPVLRAGGRAGKEIPSSL